MYKVTNFELEQNEIINSAITTSTLSGIMVILTIKTTKYLLSTHLHLIFHLTYLHFKFHEFSSTLILR